MSISLIKVYKFNTMLHFQKKKKSTINQIQIEHIIRSEKPTGNESTNSKSVT